MNIDKNVTEGPKTTSEHFNDYFVKIDHAIAESVSNRNISDFKPYLKNSVSQTITPDSPEPIEIFNTIHSLDIHKARGFDNISSYSLPIGNKIPAPILSAFFHQTFELGIFRQIFKTAKVIPIFKSGNKELVNNYRPISLLPCLSKPLEN